MFKNHLKKIACGAILGASIVGVVIAAPYKTEDIVVNGAKVEFSPSMGKPVNINGRTHVPIRIMADALGYETGWEQATKTASVKGEGSTIQLKIDSPRAKINGVDTYIDVREDGKPVLSTTASVRDGRTYVPLRFVTETLGCEVRFEMGVTYINNGNAPVITGDKYFKEMPDIPGTATFNAEKDYATLKEYFGDKDSGRSLPTYGFLGIEYFIVCDNKENNSVDFVVLGWPTDSYNREEVFRPEYAEMRGVISEVFKFYLPKGGEKLYSLIDDGFNGRLENSQSIVDIDIQSLIGSDGRKVVLTTDASKKSVIQISK